MKTSNLSHLIQRVLFGAVLSFTMLVLVSCGQGPAVQDNASGAMARGIANGTKVTSETASEFGPVVMLYVNSKSLCTSSYVGHGNILTAWHCIGLQIQENDGVKPSIKVISPATLKWIGPMTGDDYDVKLPTVEKTEDVQEQTATGMKTIHAPQPDLAIIHLNGDFTAKLDEIPTAATLPTEELTVGEAGLNMAGYGMDDYNQDANVGLLNFGTAKLGQIDDFFYYTGYTADDNGRFSAALPGDSGGPLFKRDSSGGVQVYAVASTLSAKKNPAGTEVISAENRYVRLDRDPVRQWFKTILNLNQ